MYQGLSYSVRDEGYIVALLDMAMIYESIIYSGLALKNNIQVVSDHEQVLCIPDHGWIPDVPS